MTRRTRSAALVGLAVVCAAGLYALDRSPASAGHGDPPAPSVAPATGTVSTSAPPTTVPGPPYSVATSSMIVPAVSGSGTAVQIPTALFYPQFPGVRTTFPLLVFSPGYQIDPAAYSPLLASWAADGYVVAEATYPDTAPGSPAIETDMVNHPGELSQVITYLLRQSSDGTGALGGLLNPAEIAVAGQSDGGDVSLAAVADSCCRDTRIKAAVILSGAEATLFGGTYYSAGNPPLMVVQGGQDDINPPGCSEQLYDGASQPRYYLGIPAASHLSAYTEAGPELSVVQAVTRAFLDGYVKGEAAELATLPQLGNQPGVSELVAGATAVPESGYCPGAP